MSALCLVSGFLNLLCWYWADSSFCLSPACVHENTASPWVCSCVLLLKTWKTLTLNCLEAWSCWVTMDRNPLQLQVEGVHTRLLACELCPCTVRKRAEEGCFKQMVYVTFHPQERQNQWFHIINITPFQWKLIRVGIPQLHPGRRMTCVCVWNQQIFSSNFLCITYIRQIRMIFCASSLSPTLFCDVVSFGPFVVY